MTSFSEELNIRQLCPISLHTAFKVLGTHTQACIVQGMVQSSENQCPSRTCSNHKQVLSFCLILLPTPLKILKQNPIDKDMINWNNRKPFFNAVISNDCHLTQSTPAFRADRQVRDVLTVTIKRWHLHIMMHYYFIPEKINLIKSQLHGKKITAQRTASDWQ